jgi:hypothetical protein
LQNVWTPGFTGVTTSYDAAVCGPKDLRLNARIIRPRDSFNPRHGAPPQSSHQYRNRSVIQKERS